MYYEIMYATLHNVASKDAITHLTSVASNRHIQFNGANCSSFSWPRDASNIGKPQVFIALFNDVDNNGAWMFEASHPFISHYVEFQDGYIPTEIVNGGVAIFLSYNRDDIDDEFHYFDDDQYDTDSIVKIANLMKIESLKNGITRND